MHYDISYENLPREEADAKALADIVEYLGQKKFDEITTWLSKAPFTTVNFVLSFLGIQGYPFHAYCRKYHLAAYREWMAGDDDPVPTDEQGFPRRGMHILIFFNPSTAQWEAVGPFPSRAAASAALTDQWYSDYDPKVSILSSPAE